MITNRFASAVQGDFIVCERGTRVWPGHQWGKWKATFMFQRRKCKNCGLVQEERLP